MLFKSERSATARLAVVAVAVVAVGAQIPHCMSPDGCDTFLI